jgi:hypothetical protein
MGKSSPFKKFLKVFILLVILAGALYGAEYHFHILHKPFKIFNAYLAQANSVAYKDMFWGISTGTVFVIAILIILPVLMRNINTRSYFKNLYQGIISSLIFFISQTIYQYCAKISKFYLLVAIIGIAVITLILIRIVAAMYKQKTDKMEFRTAYIASITAGLIFSVLLQVISLWINWARANFHLKI